MPTPAASGRRKPRSIPELEYARTIRPKVALYHKEIMRFGVGYAFAWLRNPRSVHRAHREDLKADIENAKDVAADVFQKLLSGDRQDWDGNPETLERAVGSAINSVLSGRYKRDDNIHLSYIDDTKLEWFYSSATKSDDPELEEAEERADRQIKARLIKGLFPPRGYEVELLILSTMILVGAYNADAVAMLLKLKKEDVSRALIRFAAYTKTDEFAIRLKKTLGEPTARLLPNRIHDLAEEVVKLRCKAN